MASLLRSLYPSPGIAISAFLLEEEASGLASTVEALEEGTRRLRKEVEGLTQHYEKAALLTNWKGQEPASAGAGRPGRRLGQPAARGV